MVTTTPDGFASSAGRSIFLERHCLPLIVSPPSATETFGLLRQAKEPLEKHHRVELTEEAFVAAVELAERLFRHAVLPDVAIDLVDDAAAALNARRRPPADVRDARLAVASVRREKEAAIAAQQYERATAYREQEAKLLDDLALLERRWQESPDERAAVSVEDVARAAATLSGTPLSQVMEGLAGWLPVRAKDKADEPIH